MTTTTERFTKIRGYPNYEVSNLGRVQRVLLRGRRKPLRGWISQRYYTVKLSNEYGERSFSVHRLVLMHFGPAQPMHLPFALHKDDDKSNNAIDNLMWGNQKMNGQMAIKNGVLVDYHLKTYLTKDEADEAVKAFDGGESMKKIAARMGCSRWTVSNIVRGKIKKFL